MSTPPWKQTSLFLFSLTLFFPCKKLWLFCRWYCWYKKVIRFASQHMIWSVNMKRMRQCQKSWTWHCFGNSFHLPRVSNIWTTVAVCFYFGYKLYFATVTASQKGCKCGQKWPKNSHLTNFNKVHAWYLYPSDTVSQDLNLECVSRI